MARFFLFFAKFLTIYFNRTASLYDPRSSPESFARTSRASASESKVPPRQRSRLARRSVEYLAVLLFAVYA
jgi:hypothetical protein